MTKISYFEIFTAASSAKADEKHLKFIHPTRHRGAGHDLRHDDGGVVSALFKLRAAIRQKGPKALSMTYSRYALFAAERLDPKYDSLL